MRSEPPRRLRPPRRGTLGTASIEPANRARALYVSVGGVMSAVCLKAHQCEGRCWRSVHLQSKVVGLSWWPHAPPLPGARHVASGLCIGPRRHQPWSWGVERQQRRVTWGVVGMDSRIAELGEVASAAGATHAPRRLVRCSHRCPAGHLAAACGLAAAAGSFARFVGHRGVATIAPAASSGRSGSATGCQGWARRSVIAVWSGRIKCWPPVE